MTALNKEHQQYCTQTLDAAFASVGLNIISDVESKALANSGLIAGTFDALGIEQIIETYVGKTGSHVKVSSGAIVKALVLQLLAAPFQSLYGTSEYFSRMPIAQLLNADIKADDLNRHTLSRLLDDIDAVGPEKLFMRCAKAACDAFNIKVTEVQLDSTSFHYDGQSREEQGCELVLKKGYSRDHRPELNQVIQLGLVDGLSKFPLLFKTESGNVNDKTSFKNLITNFGDELKAQFQDLKYLIADSALCTTEIFKEARAKDIHVITRIPDSSEVFKNIIATYKESELEPIYDEQDCHVYGKFCGTDVVAGQKVKLLLISNKKMQKQKTETVNKKAEKELEATIAKIKKLSTQPKKCMKDAQDEVLKIKNKLKYCIISDITYIDVKKNISRGRPLKGQEAEQKVVAVKVTAKVSIDKATVAKAIENELMFVIATTDTRRKWKMQDLYSNYIRQSVIERKWRICKKPSIMIDAIYLKSPRRINALMWIMSIALLVYAATELKIRTSMQKHNLSIPTPDHKGTLSKPTLDRFNQYLCNARITLTIDEMNRAYISGITRTLASVLLVMGEHWIKYFRADYYVKKE